jgi:hypothetical protein
MHYDKFKHHTPADFKRLTGVRPEIFQQMLDAVKQHRREFGRPCTLSRADQVLLTLMYWREYRTQFHIAQTYGVSEATVYRTITKIENALLRSKQFRLPGKKALRPSDTRIEVVVVDATESPVERPKKDNGATAAARKSATRRKPT